ncbi:MAG: hypothetical protein WCV86_01055 [Patescibacteria group bacterium]|jgi:dolichol kinase
MHSAINYKRTIFHVCGGMFGMLVALTFPFPEILVISSTFFGIALIIEVMRNRSLSFHDEFVSKFGMLMKPTERGTVLGFTWTVGATLLLSFLQDFRPMAVGMLVWTFADPMAMLAGRLLPNTRRLAEGKTLEGTIAFFLTATLVAALFLITVTTKHPVYVMAPVIGAAGAFVELISRQIKIDDNFSIPLVAGLVTYFLVI